MKLTLSKVSYCAALSEETNAFSATVCIDGKPAFGVSNQGQGGGDMHHPLPKQSYEQMRAEVARVEAFAKTLPADMTHGFPMHPDVEILVADAFTA